MLALAAAVAYGVAPWIDGGIWLVLAGVLVAAGLLALDRRSWVLRAVGQSLAVGGPARATVLLSRGG